MATVLPLLGLGAAGVLVPILAMRVMPDDLWGLALAGAVSVVVLTAGGAILFVLLYGEPGVAVARQSGSLGTAGHFLALGLRAALVWGPVLTITLLGLGQGVERRRGERLAARQRD